MYKYIYISFNAFIVDTYLSKIKFHFFSNLANRKSKQLQWKVLHRIIYTEERLQKMNKSPNGSCHFCKDPENLMHLFVNCKLVDSVWTEIFQKINEFYEQNEIKTTAPSQKYSRKQDGGRQRV